MSTSMNNKKQYKLLLVDDDPTLRLIAEKKLAQQGYRIKTVGTGQECLRCCAEQPPDLLLLDYELPDMSGAEVCKRLREGSGCAEKPVLFITGKDDYASIETAFKAGATDFLSKPLNWDILNYRIQYMLRAHEIYLSLQSSQERLKKAQKIAKIANWDYIVEENRFYWSDAFFQMLAVSDQDAGEFSLDRFLALVPDAERPKVKRAIEDCISKGINFEIEHELSLPNGKRRAISHLGHVVKNGSGHVIDCLGTIQDITERREIEGKIRKLAYFDSLTGLMNRDSFLKVLDKILATNAEHRLLSALLFIDLDDFKRVNDTLGHNYGDQLICDVAERLKRCVRTAAEEKQYGSENQRIFSNIMPDSVFRLSSSEIKRFDLCRLGGDEFTVFLVDIMSEDVAASVAKRLLKVLEKPFQLDEHEVYITFSIGIAIAPHDGDTIETLLKNADTAMYSAKANGKNTYQFYTQEMNERYLHRLTLESHLRNALAKNELFLVYQPQYCLQSGRLIGCEALMRWRHQSQGEIPPSEFIQLAEETGQILPIGDWLFEQCLEVLRIWIGSGMVTNDFKLSLNVSSLQFHQPNIIKKVKQIFSDLELNKHIGFELTETVMMKNAAANLDKLNKLAELNLTLAIDDFGTGYSSLSYLHRFPVSGIKIDRYFIANLEKEEQINIVRAIIAMAHGMNIKVVAEGVETQWQYDFLRAESCDIAQGFFLGYPMPNEQFQQLLRSS